jgi:hypothetical protein
VLESLLIGEGASAQMGSSEKTKEGCGFKIRICGRIISSAVIRHNQIDHDGLEVREITEAEHMT